MAMEHLSFSVSKGELPIELSQSTARFLGKLLRDITELNWGGHWAFWEWFWAGVLGVGVILGIVAVLRKLRD